MIISFSNIYFFSTVITYHLGGKIAGRRMLKVHAVAVGAEELLPVIRVGLELVRLVSSRQQFLRLVSIQNILLGFDYVLLPIAFLHNRCHVFFGQFLLKLVSV